MRDIIEKIKEIINEQGKESLINLYKLSYGVYVRVSEDSKEVREEDIYTVDKNTNIEGSIETYNWFRERNFFDEMLNMDSNRAVCFKAKQIHSATPHSIIMKFGTIKSKDVGEILRLYFADLNKMHDGALDEEKLVNIFSRKIADIYRLMGDKVKDITRLYVYIDKTPDEYEEAYGTYLRCKATIDGNKNFPGIKGMPWIGKKREYGISSISYSQDYKKPILTSDSIRYGSYLLPYEEVVIFNYISKLSGSLNEIMGNNNGVRYEISLSGSEISKLDKYITADKCEDYNNFSIFASEDIFPVTTVEKNRAEILYLIDSMFTDGAMRRAVDWNISTQSEVSDYIKHASVKMGSLPILQLILTDRDRFRAYTKSQYDVNITVPLEKLLKKAYEYQGDKLEKNRDSSEKSIRAELMKKLDEMLRILDYVSKKGGYRNMAKTINHLLDKFKEEKMDGGIIIENDAEFYFMCGQMIRYLANLSKSGDRSSGLMGNYMLRSKNKLKNKIIDMYNTYVHALPLHSTKYVNLAYQAIIGYDIEGAENTTRKDENWYYYQAGIAGDNVFYYSVQPKNSNQPVKND